MVHSFSDSPPRTELAGVVTLQPVQSVEKPDSDALAARCLEAAALLGFRRAGICTADPFEEAQAHLDSWRKAEMHGGMQYLGEPVLRGDPRQLLPDARSVLVVGLAYPSSARTESSKRQLPLHGEVAAYAQFEDYHGLMKQRLRQLAQRIADAYGAPVRARVCVDTAPLLEREAAARAGLGFIGKSTMLIAPGTGTYLLLGALVLDVDLPVGRRLPDGCGKCTLCMDACPTHAFPSPYVLDARRCVSYLTIESREPIPRELRKLVSNMIFGCDICQSACPYNAAKGAATDVPGVEKRHLATTALTEILGFGSAAYKRYVAGTALRRVSKAQLQRNVAVALGNSGDPSVVPALVLALQTNSSAMVREHCVWALGELATPEARAALERALQDPDSVVRAEAVVALDRSVPAA